MKKNTAIALGITGLISGVLAYLYLTPSGNAILSGAGLSTSLLPSGSNFSTYFGSGGSSGGIGSTPSDLYDYAITPSNNPNNLTNQQAFKQNYKLIGAVATTPQKLPSSQVPIGYSQGKSTIITNSTPTNIISTSSTTSTKYSNPSTITGQSPYITQNGNAITTNIKNVVPVSGTGNPLTKFYNQPAVLKAYGLPSGFPNFNQLIKNPLAFLNSSSLVSKTTTATIKSTPAIKLSNGSIFPFINGSNSSTNASLLYNGSAYAGLYYPSNKTGKFYFPANNSVDYVLNNVTNGSYVLQAQNVSSVSPDTTVTKVTSTTPSVSASNASNVSMNSQLIDKIEHINSSNLGMGISNGVYNW